MSRKLPPATNPVLDHDALSAVLGPPSRAAAESSSGGKQTVAVATPSPELMAAVRSASKTLVVGPDGARRADAIVVAAHPGVGDEVARLRASARADAAVVCVVDRDQEDLVREAHDAGAFACVRRPIDPRELAGVLTSALEATAAKAKAALLTEEMGVQAHLAAIGRMSAGLTHEINNPLTVAIMGENFVRGELPKLIEAEDIVAAIATATPAELPALAKIAREHMTHAAVHRHDVATAMTDLATSHARIQGLTGNLRLLFGHDDAKRERVRLADVVEDVRRWAAPQLSTVTVEDQLDENVEVVGDPMLLRQIVLNFATNAVNSASSLPAARVRFHVYASATHGIVSIRDNGPGIPEALHDKIFDPFFTTRRNRGGTGLGLSLCREFARKMGAELSFWSAERLGACFRVHIPLVTEAT